MVFDALVAFRKTCIGVDISAEPRCVTRLLIGEAGCSLTQVMDNAAASYTAMLI